MEADLARQPIKNHSEGQSNSVQCIKETGLAVCKVVFGCYEAESSFCLGH